MITREDLPETPDWSLPKRCCGTFADDLACSICGQWVKYTIPSNIELGAE